MECLISPVNVTERQTLQHNTDVLFLIVMGSFLFFMQAGFAFLESGSVRSKNTTNILLKNFLNVCVGAVVYWSLGFAFAYGEPSNPVFGYGHFFFANLPSRCYHFWFFNSFFAITASTIVSGALAERTEFVAYLISSCVITGVINPVVTHWQWADSGWLRNGPNSLQFMDFAGCGSVHLVGGTAALVGAVMVGPRLGRFDEKGKLIEGHTIPQSALGGFILFLGFLAFNSGSQLSISKNNDGTFVSRAATNTILSGSMGAIVSMTIKRAFHIKKQGPRRKVWSLLVALNGGLTGMVAIGAGSNVVASWGSVLTGTVAGFVYVVSSTAIVKLRIDDPLHASAVHLGGGLWGILSVPFLNYFHGILTSTNSTLRKSFQVFGWNILGALVIIIWSGVITGAVFGTLKCLGKLRVPADVEEKGLDLAKHGEAAYPLSAYGHGWEDEPIANDISNDDKVFDPNGDELVCVNSEGDAGVFVRGGDHNSI